MDSKIRKIIFLNIIIGVKMDIMTTLWQIGIIAAVLVFGVKIGLASGLANLSRKLFGIICIGYGAGVLIISSIASIFSNQITAAIYTYNSLFYIIMAAVMIGAGLLTIREWKVHGKNTSKATSMAIIAPCPCCFGSIVSSILVVAPAIGIGSIHLSVIVAATLIIVMIGTYFASKTIVKYIKKPFPVILGNFMLFLGAYFLLSSIVIPNIVNILSKGSERLTLSSPDTIIACIVFIILLIIVGIFLNKKGESLLK